MVLAYVPDPLYLCPMFIRQVKKQNSKAGKVFYQYCLVQAARLDNKVVQTILLYLGSHPLLDDKVSREQILVSLKALIFNQPDLFIDDVPDNVINLAKDFFAKYQEKHSPKSEELSFEDRLKVGFKPAENAGVSHTVYLDTIENTNVRSYGAENLCAQVVERLEIPQKLNELGFSQSEINVALMAIIARAIYCESEHKTAQIINQFSALKTDIYRTDKDITHKALYKTADKLYAHKTVLDNHLYNRVTNLFSLEDKIVIFDISNTYFEGRKANNILPKFGRSKEKRTDAKVVVFTGVINSEGFIRHSRIYEGNRPDANTLDEMISDLMSNSPIGVKKTVVIDAGIATQKNLESLKAKGLDYVCVKRGIVKEYELLDSNMKFVKDNIGNEIKLSIVKTEKNGDRIMYIESERKKDKEQSMQAKLGERFEAELGVIKAAIGKKKGIKTIQKVWEGIGKAKQRHPRYAHMYEIKTVEDKEKGIVTDLNWEQVKTKSDKQNGIYFIQTSLNTENELELWGIYNTIRNIESTFRCLKSELNIRPVFHQKDERIESHIYLTILAYQLVNTIRHMTKASGINDDWSNILLRLRNHVISTIEVKGNKSTIAIRKTSKTEKQTLEIYQATNTSSERKKKDVVYH